MDSKHRARRAIVLATIVSFVSAPILEAVGAQTSGSTAKPATSTGTPQAKPAPPATTTKPAPTTTAKPASTTTAKPAAMSTTPATTPQPIDGGWPRAGMTPSGGEILMYQPQIASWTNQKTMSLFAAVSYAAKSGDKPALGTIKADTDTKVSLDERLVSFSPLRIVESNFPTLSRDQIRELVERIDSALSDADRVIALDRVLESVDKSQILPKNVEGVKSDPPPIFFSKTPAVLVNLDGDPIWSPIRDNDLKFAVNTNWDLFLHDPSKTYYLRNNDTWIKTLDLKGAWTPAGKLPESFSKLPKDDKNWDDVIKNLPGKSLTAARMPKVFVSTTPAEMILLNGEPSYVTVQGTDLLWVNNTESDVFRPGRTGPVYFLVAGRWFSAPDFTGPWTFATTNLPASFQRIPAEHARSRVLASVPGTQQAAEAVLLAQVPQTAKVNRKQLKAPEVEYQGDPKFEPIEKTKVERAVNTDKEILKVGDLYYMCFDGVWFMSRAATGPWEVASSVSPEIYTIPASSPVHNVTYVVIEEDDDDNDEWVTFAVVAGYTGMMMAYGCAVWGTGWYYPPYYYGGGFYPAYYPGFHSYGYSAWYNPWTGGYGRSAVAYGPYGGVGASARYNPRTGTYSRGAVAWGPYGASGAASAFNPRTGASAQTRQGSNVYGSWGSTSVQRGDDWARTARTTNNVTGTTNRVTQGSGGGTAVTRNTPGAGGSGVARTGSGDVYAGRDGNVYRRNDDGSWQQNQNGSWNNVDTGAAQQKAQAARDGAGAATTRDAAGAGTARGNTAGAANTAASRPQVDSATAGQLQRDGAARTQGTQRTTNSGDYKSSGGNVGSRSGSYRPSGGMRSGGGGGRR